jgi:hypothetical protein
MGMGRIQSSGHGCRGAVPPRSSSSRPRSREAVQPDTTSGPHDKRARGNAGEARQGTVAQGPTGTARGGRSEEARATGTAQRGPQPIQGPCTPTRVSFECPTTCAQPRESRGHGRSTLRSVVLITTKPDRGADVPQMYRVRRHRRIEAPTPVAMQTCQVKQPRHVVNCDPRSMGGP